MSDAINDTARIKRISKVRRNWRETINNKREGQKMESKEEKKIRLERLKQTKIITKKAFDFVCKKYKCSHEDIRDCTVKNIPARTAFIEFLSFMEVPIASIGQMLGERTVKCIQSYLDGKGGDLPSRRTITDVEELPF